MPLLQPCDPKDRYHREKTSHQRFQLPTTAAVEVSTTANLFIQTQSPGRRQQPPPHQIGDEAVLNSPLTRSHLPHLANVLPGICTTQTSTSTANQLMATLNPPSRHLRLHLPRSVPLEERYYSPQTSPVCPAFRTRRECCRHHCIVLPLPRLLLTCLLMTCLYLYFLHRKFIPRILCLYCLWLLCQRIIPTPLP